MRVYAENKAEPVQDPRSRGSRTRVGAEKERWIQRCRKRLDLLELILMQVNRIP